MRLTKIRVEITKGMSKGEIYNATLVEGFYECHTSFGVIDFPADYVKILN